MTRLIRQISALFVVAACLAIVVTIEPWQFETDLSKLTSVESEDALIGSVEQQLAKKFENRVVISLSGLSKEDVQIHASFVKSKIDQSSFFVEDTIANPLEFSNQYSNYRHVLLTDDQRSYLSSTDRQAMFENALQDLYSIDRWSGSLSIIDDPLNLLSQFLSDNFQSQLLYEDGVFWLQADQSDRSHAFLMLTLKKDALDLNFQEEVSQFFLNLERELEDSKASVELRTSGVVFHAAYAAKKAKQEIFLISIGSIVGIVLLFLLSFRSIKPILFCLLSIGFGFLFALSVTNAIFGSLHIITIVFGASLIGVAIDYGVHYLSHAQNDAQNVLDRVLKSLLLSLLSTILAYACLWQTDLRVLKEISLFSISGLFASAVFVITFFPWLCRTSPKEGVAFTNIVAGFYSRWNSHRALAKLIIVCFPVVSVGVLLSFTEFSSSIRAFYSPPEKFVSNDIFIAQNLNEFSSTQYLLVEGKSPEELLQNLESVTESIKSLKHENVIQNFLSPSVLIPSNKTQKENYALLEKIVYGPDGLAWQILSSLGMSESELLQRKQAFNQQADRFLTVDQALMFAPGQLESLWLGELLDERYSAIILLNIASDNSNLALKQLNKIAAASHVHFVDRIESMSTNLSSLRHQATLLLLVAYGVVAVVIINFFRQLDSMLIVLIPLCSSLAVIFILTCMGISISLFHILGLFLLLGLGLDYTIFIYNEARELSDGVMPISMKAVWLSALTSSLSFGLLSASSTPMIQQFGLTMLLGSLLNLLFSPLVVLLRRKRSDAVSESL